MKVTDVEIVSIGADPHDCVAAFAVVTLDGCLVIHGVRVIRGASGLLVAMPNRKGHDHCPKCRTRNDIDARYCGNCGARRADERATVKGITRHIDVVHPIVQECRDMIDQAVLAAYERAIEGGVSRHVQRRDAGAH